MANLFALSPGYAYSMDSDPDGMPETVVLPAAALDVEACSDGYMPSARKGFVDGSRVIWIDTPVGTFGQMEHMVRDIRSERRAKGMCPTCGKVALSRRQRAVGHQCNTCADLESGAF
jgi:hypothetical protein